MAKKQKTEEVDIFATVETKTSTTKKTEKVKIRVPKEGDELITEYLKLKEEIDAKTSKLETVNGKLKAMGVEKYLEQYAKENKNVGSFLLENSKSEVILFTPKDQYLKLNEEDHTYLKEKYEGQVSETTETFAFDSKMFTKHRAAISKALMSCKEIPAEDKPKLFTKTVAYIVKKGTLDKLGELRTWLSNKMKREVTFNEVFDDARVITAMSPREE